MTPYIKYNGLTTELSCPACETCTKYQGVAKNIYCAGCDVYYTIHDPRVLELHIDKPTGVVLFPEQ